MARCIQDLQLLFGVLVESETPTNSLDHYRLGMRGWRVAWYANDDVVPVPEETRCAVEKAARALADAGLVAEECRPPGVERGFDLWLKLFSRASVVQLRQVYAGREDEGGSFVSWRLATADDTPPPTLDEYIANWMERDRLREELLRWMETTPIIVAPVGATPAYPHDTLKITIGGSTVGTFRAFSYAQAFNVFDLPVVTVPAGRSSEGLPIGVQVVGPPFAEEMVLAAAEIIEESTD